MASKRITINRKTIKLAGPSYLSACSDITNPCSNSNNFETCLCSANYPAIWIWQRVISL